MGYSVSSETAYSISLTQTLIVFVLFIIKHIAKQWAICGLSTIGIKNKLLMLSESGRVQLMKFLLVIFLSKHKTF